MHVMKRNKHGSGALRTIFYRVCFKTQIQDLCKNLRGRQILQTLKCCVKFLKGPFLSVRPCSPTPPPPWNYSCKTKVAVTAQEDTSQRQRIVVQHPKPAVSLEKTRRGNCEKATRLFRGCGQSHPSPFSFSKTERDCGTARNEKRTGRHDKKKFAPPCWLARKTITSTAKAGMNISNSAGGQRAETAIFLFVQEGFFSQGRGWGTNCFIGSGRQAEFESEKSDIQAFFVGCFSPGKRRKVGHRNFILAFVKTGRGGCNILFLGQFPPLLQKFNGGYLKMFPSVFE